jgi:hypothetical protein
MLIALRTAMSACLDETATRATIGHAAAETAITLDEIAPFHRLPERT